jgi:Fic family protein
MDQEIKKLKKEIDNLKPLSKGELAELKKWYDVTYTFHSNAIEGNTLTLAETKIIVEDGLTVAGHPLREILEAKNHKEVIDDLIRVVQKKKDLDEKILLKLHKILIKSIDDENAGKYRKVQVYITGEEKLPPKAQEIPTLMKIYFLWYDKNKKKINPVDLAATAHYRLVKIHPFVDGNGRIARIISNLILMRAGYPLVIIPIVRRQDYISSLSSKKFEKDFVKFFKEIVLENIKDYLRMIK